MPDPICPVDILAPMTGPQPLLARLRNSSLRRVWLVVLALASALSGLHVATHVGDAFAAVPSASAAPGSDGGGGDKDHRDHCPLCRLADSGTLPLLPVAWLVLLFARCAGGPGAAPTLEHCAADAASRWCQRRKHGPPAFSR